MKQIHKLSLSTMLCALLVACGGGGGSSGGGNQPSPVEPTLSNVTAVVPIAVPTGLDYTESYTSVVKVTNNNSADISNLTYSFSGPNAKNISVVSTHACSSISAGQSCYLGLNIGGDENGGSFQITINQSTSNTLSKLTNKLGLTSDSSSSLAPIAVQRNTGQTQIQYPSYVLKTESQFILTLVNPPSNVQTISFSQGINYEQLPNVGLTNSLDFLIKPSNVNQPMSGQICFDGSNCQPFTVNFVTGGILNVLPLNVVFTKEDTSFSRDITLYNAGNTSITSLKIPELNSLIQSGYILDTSNCPISATDPLKAKSSCNITLSTTLDNISSESAISKSLVLTSTDASGATITKVATIDPYGGINLSKLNQFQTFVGESVSQELTITNYSANTLTNMDVESLPNGFSSTNNTCTTLTTGQSCTITIQYSPTAVNDATADIKFNYQVNDNAYNTLVPVIYKSIDPQVILAIDPSTYEFGKRLIGSSYQTTVTLFNNGNITSSGITANSSDSHFKADLSQCQSLAANASCQATVTYTPTKDGSADSGTITFSSNSGISSTVSLSVSGTAVQSQIQVSNVQFNTTPESGIYWYESGTTIKLTTTLTNKLSSNLTNLKTSLIYNLDHQSNLVGSGCDSLNAGESCTVTFEVNAPSSLSSSFNLDLSNSLNITSGGSSVSFSLSNDSSNEYSMRFYDPATVSSYLVAENSACSSSNGQFTCNQSAKYQVKFSLIGGHNVPASEYKLTNPTGVIPSNGSCTLSSNNSNCTVEQQIAFNSNLGANSITLTGDKLAQNSLSLQIAGLNFCPNNGFGSESQVIANDPLKTPIWLCNTSTDPKQYNFSLQYGYNGKLIGSTIGNISCGGYDCSNSQSQWAGGGKLTIKDNSTLYLAMYNYTSQGNQNLFPGIGYPNGINNYRSLCTTITTTSISGSSIQYGKSPAQQVTIPNPKSGAFDPSVITSACQGL
ncbi:MAG: Abnormal spindle-like microcephaly-assocd, ASPM-SPD-2-Hydin [Pseudomonadota bacterium]|jgi:hypothetical protein